MVFSGCQSKSKEISIMTKICPRCGHEIEMFSIDTQAECENCGFTVYNDSLSCVQWCKYAKQCVGEKVYEQMMKIAEEQKKQAKQKNNENLQRCQ